MKFYVYLDTSKQYRWRLKAANNSIIADSGESYANKADCLAGIKLVQGSASAPVEDQTVPKTTKY